MSQTRGRACIGTHAWAIGLTTARNFQLFAWCYGLAFSVSACQHFSFWTASFLAILPARLYNLGVPDSMAQISSPRQRRHRRRRFRRFFQILAAGLLFSALLYLAIHLITKTRSSSDPDVPEDSTVQFK